MTRLVMATLLVVSLPGVARAQKEPSYWEFDGSATNVYGVFAEYISPGAPVTLMLYGAADQPSLRLPCPPETNSATYELAGAWLQLGKFVYRGTYGVIERNNENRSCGRDGAPLDLMAFHWQFDGDAPDVRLRTLGQIYLALAPVDFDADTLGSQLIGVTDAFGLATTITGPNVVYFTGTFGPAW